MEDFMTNQDKPVLFTGLDDSKVISFAKLARSGIDTEKSISFAKLVEDDAPKEKALDILAQYMNFKLQDALGSVVGKIYVRILKNYEDGVLSERDLAIETQMLISAVYQHIAQSDPEYNHLLNIEVSPKLVDWFHRLEIPVDEMEVFLKYQIC
ncbi:MAG: hypothetical protein WBA74_01500, partial [Cyclobacteriaceae bacterium]